jgi:hypothetical protein
LRYSALDGWALAYTLLSAALAVAMNFIFPSVY